MDHDLQFRIISPVDVLFETATTLVTMPGEEGEFGVMPMHAPLIASLKPGIVKISVEGGDEKYFIWGGIARVTGLEADVITEFAINLASTNKDVILEKISTLKDSINHESEIDKQEQLTEELLKLESLFSYL